MTNYVDDLYLDTHECGGCGIVFAMTQDFIRERKEDHKRWYCPNGCCRIFTSKSKEQKLKEKLAKKQSELEREQSNVIHLKKTVKKVASNYQRMRDRVKNGVCPCCDRTFQNLFNHMKTKHPDFGKYRILKTLRTTYGLTQEALSSEIGINIGYISKFERQRPVPAWATEEIESWITQGA